MTTHTTVIHDQPPTRDDLIEKVTHLNNAAKTISRRGYVGIASAEYKRRHDDINDALTQLIGH